MGGDNPLARLLGHFLNLLQRSSERIEWLEMIFKQEHLFHQMFSLFKDTRNARISRLQRIQYLRDTMSDPKVGLLSFTPITLPYDAEVTVIGTLPHKLTVYKSTAMPVKVSFITTTISEHAMIIKAGEDMRIDVFTHNALHIFDEIWRRNDLDLKLTKYRCQSITLDDGILEYIHSEPLSTIIAHGTITSYLASTSPEDYTSDDEDNESEEAVSMAKDTRVRAKSLQESPRSRLLSTLTLGERKKSTFSPVTMRRMTNDFSLLSHRSVMPTEEVLDTFVRSCAGYCVFTYVMGVGDRHLDNLLLTRDGHFFHIDFSYIFGADPKPFPPPMKLCKEMVEAMGGPTGIPFIKFKAYCIRAFIVCRKYVRLLTAFIDLTCPPTLQSTSTSASSSSPWSSSAEARDYVIDRLFLTMDEGRASKELERLIDESMNALFPKVFETLHKWAQYWRQ